MPIEPTLAAAAEHDEAIDGGEHLLQQLRMRDVAQSEDTLVIEMPVHGTVRNSRGALQGGLVATLIDVAAGRLAMVGCPAGFSTATTDITVHFLAPIVAGRPARHSDGAATGQAGRGPTGRCG